MCSRIFASSIYWILNCQCHRDACRRYKELWKRKHETGQWLEIEAAEAMSNRPEFSAMNASGIVLSSMTNKQNELPENNGKVTTAGKSSISRRCPTDRLLT